MTATNNLEELAKLVRYYILMSTSAAGSGHMTSSLSATDLMTVLMFGGFLKADLEDPQFPNNDRLIFSKGHAAPLLYSLYAAAGKVSKEELLSLRKFSSALEGHPTMDFPFTEVPTGSLGQGLSVGVGMALSARLDKLPYRTFVLLGDSEMAEGSVWEAMACAVHYTLGNLVGILDVNRLGQRGETMHGHDIEAYRRKSESFGWQTIVIDGHNIEEIRSAFELAFGSTKSSFDLTKSAQKATDKPVLIIAKTVKGKGGSFVEDKEGWHGKALSQDELKKALDEMGAVDTSLVGDVAKPASGNIGDAQTKISGPQIVFTDYGSGKKVSTRKAYGNMLPNILNSFPNAVVLDAEVSNSTFAESVTKTNPKRFFEMYIAEQNMVGASLGFSKRGKIPFVSTFAAFFTRAFDQIRMSQYAKGNIKFIGSHGGVSVGEDGPSQMGLEEISMFRTLLDCVVLYPSDAVSMEKLLWLSALHYGNVYIQTVRSDVAILYGDKEDFSIGGSKTLRSSSTDVATVVGVGITVNQALAAYEELQKEKINIRVIDLYSVKPLDRTTLKKAAEETKAIITVEDHFAEGGIGEAVASALSSIESLKCKVVSLAVRKMPRSGKAEELLAFEEIDSKAIVKKIREMVG